MSILFCHDHKFIIGPDNSVYSSGQYSEEIVNRYERVFKTMFIAGRSAQAEKNCNTDELNLVFNDGNKFLSIPNLSNLKSLLLGNKRAKRLLEARIKEVDAVIVRLPSEIGLLALSIAKKLNKPFIVEVVACIRDGLKSHGSLLANLYLPIAEYRMRRAVSSSEWTLYVTESFLQSRYPSFGKQVCASNVQLPEDNKPDLKKEGSSRPTFGMIAAMFHAEKRVDIAISALAEAIKTGLEADLEIVGPGDTKKLKMLSQDLSIEKHVHFLGTLPHGKHLFNWLDTIDIYIQTSFQEGLPRGLIEAMNRGRPSLASNVGGTYELLDKDCLHKAGDIKTLSQQMQYINNKQWCSEQGNKNFLITKEYAPVILNPRRYSFWQEFCESNSLYS